MNAAAILAAAERVLASGPSSLRLARDPVNLPVIRAWTDAIGDANPVYTDAAFAARSVHGGLVAPPAMIQVWTMPGLGPPGPAGGFGGSSDPVSSSPPGPAGGLGGSSGRASSSPPVPSSRGGEDPLGVMTAELDAAGFTSVVATNCDQTYARYVRPGEQLAVRAELLDVTGPKRTALGEGWFVTTRSIWYCGDEPVATMDFRVLKFRPPASSPAAAATGARADPQGAGDRAPEAAAMRPPVSPDTEYFWAGTRQGELRIQRCGGCGVLRHPPGPACPRCGSIGKAEYQVAAGTGTVYSYVVHHHPAVPGKKLPIIIALVELTEGARMLGELTGADPGEVSIGMPVRVSFDAIADDLVLPNWRPDAPGTLPELRIHVTPTVVVATALATRDFYPAHHDRDLAVQRGSKDIFLNILTTTGLVERYVTDWAGPDALVRSVSIRLGVPCYAYDTLTFAGTATEAPDGERLVAVTGRCSLGDHVTGTVRLAPAGARGSGQGGPGSSREAEGPPGEHRSKP